MIKNVFYSQTVFEEKSMDLAERHQTNQNDAWFMGISGAWTPPLWMKGFMAGSHSITTSTSGSPSSSKVRASPCSGDPSSSWPSQEA